MAKYIFSNGKVHVIESAFTPVIKTQVGQSTESFVLLILRVDLKVKSLSPEQEQSNVSANAQES